MRSASSLTLALAATLLSAGVLKPTDAHMYGRGGGGGGLLVGGPRRYLYSRRSPLLNPHRDAATATTFDLMSDILSVPVYANSLMRQHHDHHHRVASELSRIEGILEGEGSGGGLEEWSGVPKHAVTEDAGAGTVELSLEVPGVTASDLSVTLEDDRVVRIAGRRTHILDGRLHEAEFDQSFRLTDDLDPEGLRVTLSSGILRIQAQKKVKAVRQIPIVTTEEEVQNVALESSSANSQETEESQAASQVDAEEGLTSEIELTVNEE